MLWALTQGKLSNKTTKKTEKDKDAQAYYIRYSKQTTQNFRKKENLFHRDILLLIFKKKKLNGRIRFKIVWIKELSSWLLFFIIKIESRKKWKWYTQNLGERIKQIS